MKQKYKYEIDATLDHTPNKPLYRLKTTKAGKEITKVVSIGQLKSMYGDDRITGHIPQYLKEKIGLPRRKVRSDKGLKKGIARKWNVPAEMNFNLATSVKWIIPNEILYSDVGPITIGKAYIFEKDGRWCVMQPDGTLDEDTYPDKEWAQSEADRLNKEVGKL